MKDINEYKLTATVTVGQLLSWLASKDEVAKNEIITLIDHRFTNRYIKHLKQMDTGFLMMAISCLTLETLESFKQGKKNTRGKSGRMFEVFFKTEMTHFPGFAEIHKDFYENVRCGILHQAETTNAWRILLSGQLLDTPNKTINAKKFVEALEKSIKHYRDRLQTEDFTSNIWKHAIVKLEDICNNCNLKNM